MIANFQEIKGHTEGEGEHAGGPAEMHKETNTKHNPNPPTLHAILSHSLDPTSNGMAVLTGRQTGNNKSEKHDKNMVRGSACPPEMIISIRTHQQLHQD